jgi:hypothetical protein
LEYKATDKTTSLNKRETKKNNNNEMVAKHFDEATERQRGHTG